MDVFHMPYFFLIHLSQSAKISVISLCKLESHYEIVLPIPTLCYSYTVKSPSGQERPTVQLLRWGEAGVLGKEWPWALGVGREMGDVGRRSPCLSPTIGSARRAPAPPSPQPRSPLPLPQHWS